LQQNPRAILVVQGFSEEKERPNVAQQRAERVRDYLTKAGIDASRIKVVSKGTATAPGASGPSQAVVIWFVPEGAKEPDE